MREIADKKTAYNEGCVYSKSVTHSVALSIMKVILDCQGMGLIQGMFV